MRNRKLHSMRFVVLALSVSVFAACATAPPLETTHPWREVPCDGFNARSMLTTDRGVVRVYDEVLAERYIARLDTATDQANAGEAPPRTPDESAARRTAKGLDVPGRETMVEPEDVCFQVNLESTPFRPIRLGVGQRAVLAMRDTALKPFTAVADWWWRRRHRQ